MAQENLMDGVFTGKGDQGIFWKHKKTPDDIHLPGSLVALYSFREFLFESTSLDPVFDDGSFLDSELGEVGPCSCRFG